MRKYADNVLYSQQKKEAVKSFADIKSYKSNEPVFCTVPKTLYNENVNKSLIIKGAI